MVTLRPLACSLECPRHHPAKNYYHQQPPSLEKAKRNPLPDLRSSNKRPLHNHRLTSPDCLQPHYHLQQTPTTNPSQEVLSKKALVTGKPPRKCPSSSRTRKCIEATNFGPSVWPPQLSLTTPMPPPSPHHHRPRTPIDSHRLRALPLPKNCPKETYRSSAGTTLGQLPGFHLADHRHGRTSRCLQSVPLIIGYKTKSSPIVVRLHR